MSPDPTPSPVRESSRRRLLLRSGRVAAATATGAVIVVSAYTLAANATSDEATSSDAVGVLDTSTIPSDVPSTTAELPDTTDGAAVVPVAPPSSTDADSDDATGDDATSDDATDDVAEQIVPDGSPMTDDDAMPAAPSGAGDAVGGGRHGGGEHGEHGGDARGGATAGSSGAVPSAPSGQPASSSGGS